MAKERIYRESDLTRIRNALDCLREARMELRNAGATRAADYVARAQKSAEGAKRHIEGHLGRMYEPG